MKKHFKVEHWSTCKNKKNRELVINQISVEDICRARQNSKRICKEDVFTNPNSNMYLLCDIIENENKLQNDNDE